MQSPLFERASHPTLPDISAPYFLDYPLRESVWSGSPPTIEGDLETARSVLHSPFEVRASDSYYHVVGKPTRRCTGEDCWTDADADREFFVCTIVPETLVIVTVGWHDVSLTYPGKDVEEAQRLFLESLGRQIQHAA